MFISSACPKTPDIYRKVPGNLISLFNSKLLKLQLLVFINQKQSGLFRDSAGASDFKTFNNSFGKELLTKIKVGNKVPILNKHNILACYVKQQLRDEYQLTGTEKEMLENKLLALKKPVNQALCVDILDIVHCQCEVAKEVTEEQAAKDKVLSLNSFAVAIGPSLYEGGGYKNDTRGGSSSKEPAGVEKVR